MSFLDRLRKPAADSVSTPPHTHHLQNLVSKVASCAIATVVVATCAGAAVISTPEQAHAENAYVTTDAYQTHKVWYGGYYTTYFWIDGHVAFCSQPRYSTPWSGVYKKNYQRNDTLAAVLYYGYGGPGWNYAKANGWWPTRAHDGHVMDNDDYYAATHVLVSYVRGGWGDALYGTNQSYKNWASSNLFGWVLTNLRNNAYTVPDAFKNSIYWCDPGYNTRSGRQGQDFVSYNWVDAGGLRLNKVDALTNKPLNGITFNIYNSDKWGNQYGYVTSITTDAAGNAATRQNQLPVGWYIMKETNPPANCAAITSAPMQVQSNFSYNYRKAVNGSYSGGTYNLAMFTNRATTQIEFKKQYCGTVAPSTVIELYRNGVATGQTRTITKQGDYNVYTWGFYNLDKYDSNGRNYTYTVKERGVANGQIVLNGVKYKVVQSGNEITNIELKDIPVEKVWEDQDDKYGMRPDKITVNLFRTDRNNNKVQVASAQLSNINNWKHIFTGMPAAENIDNWYFYSVEEAADSLTDTLYTSRVNADVITNSLNTVDIPIQKTWVGNNPKPSFIVLKAMNGASEIDRATVASDADGNWSYTFTGLPQYDKQGNEIEYTIQEETVDGYVLLTETAFDENGFEYQKLTNVSTEQISIPVSKTWTEYISPATPHPSSITVSLIADGMPTGKTMQLTQSGGWKGTFTNLPKYDVKTGQEIQYTVSEETIEQYAWDVTGNMTDGYIINNIYGSTSVAVSKIWTNENGNTSRRPASVIVKLMGDGVDTGKTVTLNSNGGWKGTFTNLPKYNNQGNEIAYTVSEIPIGFYMSSVSGNQANEYTITNKYAENETSVNVSKAWNDKDNEANLRPTSIVATLKKQTHTGAQKLALTTNPTSGTYTVYKKDNITLSMNNLYTGLWNTDKNTPVTNQIGGGKGNISANALLDYNTSVSWTTSKSNSVGISTITMSGYNTYTNPIASFDSTATTLITEANSAANAYPTVNTRANQYYSGGQKTVTYDPKLVAMNGYPVLRGHTINLDYSSGNVSTNNHTYVLPRVFYRVGNTAYPLFAYPCYYYDRWDMMSVGTDTENYISSNTYTDPTNIKIITSLTDSTWYTKGGTSYTWGRNNNSGSIYLNVPAGGSSFYPTFSTASKQYCLSFYYTASADTPITIKHQTQSGYWNEGVTLATFTAKAGTHYYTIRTNNAGTATGKCRLDFLSSTGTNLNGNVVGLSLWDPSAGMTTADTGKTLTLNASNNWSGSFENLPKFDSTTNAPIEYIVEENPVENYTPSIKQTGTAPNYTTANAATQNPYYSYSITNTLGELRDIPVTKIWNDNDDALKFRPAAIPVKLYSNGTDTGKSLELNARNNWSGTFEDLPSKASNGTVIQYTVKEDRQTRYSEPIITGTQDSGYTIENTLPITSVTVNKEWLDLDNVYNSRPGAVTIHLLTNGVDSGKKFMLSENNSWTATFENLPVYDENNAEISYTVSEDAVNSYDTTIEENENGYTVTNTLEKMSVPVKKVWDTATSQLPVASLDIELYRNGEFAATQSVSELTNWSCTFSELDVYDPDGNPYNYTVKETDYIGSERFSTEITGDVVNSYTITNIEQLDIPVYKEWNDYNDADELRPASVVIRLLANGEDTGKYLELSDINEWHGTFEGLSRYDDEHKEISYTVSEDEVDYYTASVAGTTDGFTVTNSHNIQFTERSVAKVWDDNDDIDGIRPESITVNLLQNGVQYRSTELTDANGWQYVFTKLPLADEDTGEQYTYTMEEAVPEGYEASYSQDLSLNYTITNRHAPQKTKVSVDKQWDVGDATDMIPDSITVDLLQNGTTYRTEIVESDENGRWHHDFTDLPIADADGNKYSYTVEEQPIEKFGSIIGGDQDNGYVIINRFLLSTLDVFGYKVWTGDNPVTRPDSITVNLLRDGKKIDSQEVHPNAFGQWSFSFGELPMYNEATDEEYTYTVTEDAVPGYEPEYGFSDDGGLKITNRATKSIPVEKAWKDNDNANGSRPKSIKVDLVAHRFINSDPLRYDDGVEMTLDGDESVDENKRGYVFSLDPSTGFVGEVKFDGSVKAAKIIVRSADRSQTYHSIDIAANGSAEPIAFEIGDIADRDCIFEVRDENGVDIHKNVVSLLVHDQQTVSHVADTMTLSESNNWHGKFDNVMERDNKGFLLSYTIQEEACYGYTSEVSGSEASGYVITNTEQPDIEVEKKWQASASRASVTLPDSIQVKLMCNGQDTGKRITLTADTGWSGAFENIAWRDAAGNEYDYTVEEVEVDGWQARIKNNIRVDYTATITNIPMMSLKVDKQWVGDALYEDKRPESIDAALRQKVTDDVALNGEFEQWEGEMASTVSSFVKEHAVPKNATYTLTNDSDTDAFVKITMKQSNAQVTTQVVSVPAKTTTEGTFSLEGVDQTKNVSFDVSDTNASDRTAAELAEDGKLFGSMTMLVVEEVETISVKAADEWNAAFTSVPMFDTGGRKIEYSVVEKTSVDNYVSSVEQTGDDTYVITNTFGKIDIPVEKVWNDMDDKDGIRPDSVDVELYVNGMATGNVLTLSEENGWKGVFSLLDPMDDAGNPIDYTVEEASVPEGYDATVSGSIEEGFTVTNSHDAKTQVTVTKIWDDTDNVKKIRPASLIVHLFADGEEVATAKLTGETDTWSYTFDELPYVNENGEVIEYTISEDAVEGYTQQSLQQTPDGYVIVNWTAAPLVELPFSGNTGFWLLAAAGLVLCLIVLRPHIVEYARMSRIKRAEKKGADTGPQKKDGDEQ